MDRELDPRLKELYDSGVPVYSISRLDCINRCLYEAYRTYRLHEKGAANIYANLGSKAHDVLEGIVNGEKTEADLLPAVMSELEDMDLLGIEFPKDAKGGDSIREGWVADMQHFCKTYKSPRGNNLKTEELFIYTTPAGHKLQGYIDLQKIRPDGSVDIYDYKTSTVYKGNDLKEHQRQLIVYAMGLEQMGIKVNSVAWIFLKYVSITYQGYKTIKSKNKTEITKVIERKKIAQEMADVIARDMEELGYDDVDIDSYLTIYKSSNDFSVLPEDIRHLYKMKPYVLKADLSDETRAECENYIDSTIAKWEALGDDERNFPPKSFTKLQKNGKEVLDCFFCSSLCGHFKQCHYVQDFLTEWNSQVGVKDDELFS